MDLRDKKMVIVAASAIAALFCAPKSSAETIYAVATANILVSFDSATPGAVNTTPITGLGVTESVYGIDFRPSTGQLYALAGTQALTSTLCQIYTIDPATGVATDLPAAATILAGTKYGFDFNPVVDRIRVTSNERTNVRFDPNTGALAGTDTELTSGSNVVEVAYDRSFPGATLTTLFGLDTTLDALVRIGGIDGTPSPNGGVVTTIGALGPDSDDFAALDFGGASLYAILRVGGVSQLSLVNPISGMTTTVGPIGTNPIIFGGMAVAPESLTVTKLSIKLNFAKPASDSISIQGTIPVEDGFNVSGQVLNINIGGTTKTFTLDPKGKAKVGNDSASVKVKAKGGVVLAQDAKFKASFKKGDFAANFVDEGLINADVTDQPVDILVSVNFGGVFRQVEVTLLYDGKLNKSGKAK